MYEEGKESIYEHCMFVSYGVFMVVGCWNVQERFQNRTGGNVTHMVHEDSERQTL